MTTFEHHGTELSHSMVHYLLTIHKLKDVKGYARVTDIAKELRLTKGSVSTAISGLKKKGLVREEDDTKFLVLTESGHQEVHRILSSRSLLFYFLRDFIGVSDQMAANDSCMMEHLLSPETREKFFEFMKRLTKEKTVREFKTELDFNRYQNIDEFTKDQNSNVV